MLTVQFQSSDWSMSCVDFEIQCHLCMLLEIESFAIIQATGGLLGEYYYRDFPFLAIWKKSMLLGTAYRPWSFFHYQNARTVGIPSVYDHIRDYDRLNGAHCATISVTPFSINRDISRECFSVKLCEYRVFSMAEYHRAERDLGLSVFVLRRYEFVTSHLDIPLKMCASGPPIGND